MFTFMEDLIHLVRIPAGTGRTFAQIENKAKNLDKEAKLEIEAMQAQKDAESAEIHENSQ